MKLCLVLFFLLVCHTAKSQETTTASNRKGLAILRQCFEAHGGSRSIDSLKLAFTVTNQHQVSEGQSFTPHPPFEEYPSRYQYQIDRPAGQELIITRYAIAGDFVFDNVQFLNKGKGYWCDPSLKRYSPLNSSQVPYIFYLPQNTLAAALKYPLAVRYAGETILAGKPVHQLTALQNNNIITISIDKASHLLSAVESLTVISVYGDGTRQIIYDDYTRAGNGMMAQQVRVTSFNTVNGTVKNNYTISAIKTDFSIDPALLKVPEAYKASDYSYRKNYELHQLAPGIYYLENITGTTDQWSYNILFAEMDDYVLVAEAPLNDNTTQKVISKIREVIPAKPIKYLVQSHHHSDHLGGIRGYIANGTTIVTTRDNIPVIKKIAEAPYHAYPDQLSRKPVKPVIETLSDQKLVLKDKQKEVVIYDIGPNPHAKEMLIVYFPREKILYQADMVNKNEYPVNETTKDFIKKLKALNIEVETMIGLHGKALDKQAITDLLAKEAL